jgi:hypothetical protein
MSIKRGDQGVPARLKIGPSIGDQGVKHYTFYSVAPEGIASFGDKAERHTAASINEHKSTPDHLALPGAIDWAGIGDTISPWWLYLQNDLKGSNSRRFNTIIRPTVNLKKDICYEALVPIPTDGSRTVVMLVQKITSS